MVHKLMCYRCKSDMWLPDALFSAARCSEKVEFFCAYGHAQCFRPGETEEDKLRRERDRLVQKTAQLDDEVKEANRLLAKQGFDISQLRAENAKTTRRISRGTCPCCKRTFNQMARHMQTKHPEFILAH